MLDYNHIVVVGLGKTGHACVEFLQQHDCKVSVTDSRENPPGVSELEKQFPQVSFSLGQFDQSLLLTADCIVLSPGVSPDEPAIQHCREQSIPVIGDVELFAQVVNAPVIAITATNGKSTVTELVAQMGIAAGLNICCGGNLGTPALDLWQADAPDFYVLELSSFQLETIRSLRAAVAAMLNVSPDHLDRHASYAGYIAAKQNVYSNAQVGIFNAEDSDTKPPEATKKTISFTSQHPKKNQFGLREESNSTVLCYGDEVWMNATDVKIPGKHNWLNILAAFAIGHAANFPQAVMIATAKSFVGLEHRCQWVAEHAGVNWYNDSKGTNVGAVCKAIDGLAHNKKEKIILIAGGTAKDADFSPLKEVVAEHVNAVVLIGCDASMIEKALAPDTAITHAKNMLDAVHLAKQVATKGDIVLLSPACASFDMFRNFEERGNAFVQAVQGLE